MTKQKARVGTKYRIHIPGQVFEKENIKIGEVYSLHIGDFYKMKGAGFENIREEDNRVVIVDWIVEMYNIHEGETISYSVFESFNS